VLFALAGHFVTTKMDSSPYIDVRVAQRISAPVELVFDAWIDPAIAGKWLFATAWRPMVRVSIDSRNGGSFRFAGRRRGRPIVHAGKYVEIDRPRRLAFTLAGGERRRGSTSVSVEFVPRKSGCDLRLVHEGVLPGDAAHTEGRWAGMLYGLATILERRDSRVVIRL